MKTYRKSDYFKPLEECSKEEDAEGVSEYDVAIAITRMKNEEFTDLELKQEIALVVTYRLMSSLVDKGVASVSWDPKTNDFAFSLLRKKNVK